jgi:hypothetical protein
METYPTSKSDAPHPGVMGRSETPSSVEVESPVHSRLRYDFEIGLRAEVQVGGNHSWNGQRLIYAEFAA